MKSKRVIRILKLFMMLLSGRSLRIDALAKSFEVSRRTVFRDLQAISKAGLPCYFDRQSNSYALPSDYSLLVPKLSRQEALGLLILAYRGVESLDFPLKTHALSAAMKIDATLPEDTKKYCHHVLKNISVKPSKQLNTKKLDNKSIQILNAILRKEVLRIKLVERTKLQNTEIDFCPVHLLYCDLNWYVIGKSDMSRKNIIINIRNIRRLSPTKKLFIPDDAFDLTEYLGRAWSVVREGRLYHVKLRFAPEVTEAVVNCKWHDTQSEEIQEDGSVIVEFRLDGISEITPWILGFEDKVEVLQPQILKERIASIAQRIVDGSDIRKIKFSKQKKKIQVDIQEIDRPYLTDEIGRKIDKRD